MKSENWNGFLYEHTYVMSEHIGRAIKNNENVHHLDFDKSNNNIDNLVLLSSSAHTTLHNLLDKSILLNGNIDENQIRMIAQIKEGNFIREFKSISEAEAFLGKEKGCTKISECCSGKRKTSNGYIWKFL